MKKSLLKKVVSVILALAITASFTVSVVGVTLVYYPLVYVAGINESTLYENPNKTNSEVAFSLTDSSENGFVSSCLNIAASLVFSSGIGSKNTLLSTVTANATNILSPIACKEDGTSKNPNVTTWTYNLPLSYYEDDDIDTATLEKIASLSGGKISTDDIYVFTNDWRIDPFENAEKLKDYIDVVLASTGKKKVSLLCGGYGGIAGQTYLYEYADHAEKSIYSTVFMDCPLTGNSNVGDLMSGQIYQTAGDADSLIGIIDIVDGDARGTAFLDYLNDDPTGELKAIFEKFAGEGASTTLLSVFIKTLATSIMKNESMGKDLGASYNNFVISNEEVLYTAILQKYLSCMPGLWAMVPDEYFDAAWDYMFGDSIVNASLYDKIMSYREVIGSVDEILAGAKADGIKVYVIANYDVTNLPLTASIDDESDGVVSTRHASAGATTEECGTDWEGFSACTNSYHDHMEPTGIIDASTCALPENTWFIKGLAHMDFSSDSAAQFLIWLLTADSQKTVWDSTKYTQYLRYNKYATDSITSFTNGGSYLLYGDANVNGKVDVEDAREVLRIAIGIDEFPSKEKCAAIDVNGDTYIGVDDARLILRRAVNIDHFFPVDEI